jgi:membrane associated rhomboid family serine protease
MALAYAAFHERMQPTEDGPSPWALTDPWQEHPRALLAATFAHASWGHLAGNVAVLLAGAAFLERLLPRGAFTLGFLVSAGAANAVQVHFRDEPTIGASGGVVAVAWAALAVLPLFFASALRDLRSRWAARQGGRSSFGRAFAGTLLGVALAAALAARSIALAAEDVRAIVASETLTVSFVTIAMARPPGPLISHHAHMAGLGLGLAGAALVYAVRFIRWPARQTRPTATR